MSFILLQHKLWTNLFVSKTRNSDNRLILIHVINYFFSGAFSVNIMKIEGLLNSYNYFLNTTLLGIRNNKKYLYNKSLSHMIFINKHASLYLCQVPIFNQNYFF